MNELIKELAKQANPDFTKSYIVGPWHAEDIEKFAELIVQECLKLCVEVEEDLDGIYNGDEREAAKIGSRFCYEAIKGEFGVEE